MNVSLGDSLEEGGDLLLKMVRTHGLDPIVQGEDGGVHLLLFSEGRRYRGSVRQGEWVEIPETHLSACQV